MTDAATTAPGAGVETTISVPAGSPLTVSVTFLYGGVTFSRTVPAATDAGGAYDEAATTARIDQHAETMKYRVDNGLLTNAPASDDEEPATSGA